MVNSNNTTGDYEHARSLYSQGDYEQAQQYYAVILTRIRPRDEHALQLYWEYSLCLYKLGEFAKALSAIEEGLSYYPDCRELFYIRAKINYQMGLLSHSRASFLKCISIKKSFLNYPEDIDENNRAYWYLALISAHEGKSEEAFNFLKLFTKEKPSLYSLKAFCLLLLQSGFDKALLAESLLTSNAINEPGLVQLLLIIEEYEVCLDLINRLNEKYQLYLEWIQCQLHLGRYDEVQNMIENKDSLITIDKNLIIYYCISKWLQLPRQSAGRLLAGSGYNSPYIHACLLMDEFIMNNTRESMDTTKLRNEIKSIIMKSSLELFSLGASALALDIIQHFYSCDRIEAYRQLGKKAFEQDCFCEAKILLERSLFQANEQAEDYYRLGLASSKSGFHKQATEYFLQAVVLHPENQFYPCLVIESLAIHAMAMLVQKLDSLIDNPQMINELLRLCTLKYKSKRLRQLLLPQEHNGDIYSIDHRGEEDVWNLNV